MRPKQLARDTSSCVRAGRRTGLVQAFENLSRWRAVPGYQSERRIDALLSPFIGPFLSAYFERRGHGKDQVELVTSEFPLPAKLYAEDGKTASVPGNAAADFLVLRKGERPSWILVELKTDRGSRSKEQARRYQRLSEYTMGQVLAELEAAKKLTVFGADYLKVTSLVRSKGRLGAKIEVCYLEPRRGSLGKVKPDTGLTNPPGWESDYTFGLGEVASFLDTIDDELAGLLGKFLRGAARSVKARRTKDRPRRQAGARTSP